MGNQTETMTIHRALAELKIIGSRIERAIGDTVFVVANRHSNIRIQGLTITDFTLEMRSRHRSASDLIRRRDALKKAIVLSNAVTTVLISGAEYTVAEAIEMKNTGIEYKKLLLQEMRKQYETAANQCLRENEGLTTKADNYITGMFNKIDMTKPSDEMQKTRADYVTQNTYELVESIKVLDEIKALEVEIAEFMTEVDSILSVSNALTEITFSY